MVESQKKFGVTAQFINKEFKSFLDKHKIKMYHTYGEHKSAMIERFNRTLKNDV